MTLVILPLAISKVFLPAVIEGESDFRIADG